jgi:hypothetical protein
MAEPVAMSVSAINPDVPTQYALRVEKLAQDQQKQEGAQAVNLIEQSSPPPVGPHGEGTHVNRYA